MVMLNEWRGMGPELKRGVAGEVVMCEKLS